MYSIVEIRQCLLSNQRFVCYNLDTQKSVFRQLKQTAMDNKNSKKYFYFHTKVIIKN